MDQIGSHPIRPAAWDPASSRRTDARFGNRRISSARGAFSLLELVIVLAIMAVVSTLGILRYSNSLSRYRVQSASARLIADLRVAQAEARTTSSSRTVRFVAATATYEIFTDAQRADGKPGTVVELADDPYRSSMRLVGLVGDSIAFDGRGEGNAGCIVVLKSGPAEQAVVIEPGFGRAYVAGHDD
jgi:prepilin-type N-terminal cleavage/methylation domain-containing protein